MRTISKDRIGNDLVKLLDEDYPLDEDIGIIDQEGHISGVVITKEAYEFFLRKVEEAEDRLYQQAIKTFHGTGER